MRFAFQVCLDVVSIPLEALAISAMLRGAWRRFFVAFGQKKAAYA